MKLFKRNKPQQSKETQERYNMLDKCGAMLESRNRGRRIMFDTWQPEIDKWMSTIEYIVKNNKIILSTRGMERLIKPKFDTGLYMHVEGDKVTPRCSVNIGSRNYLVQYTRSKGWTVTDGETRTSTPITDEIIAVMLGEEPDYNMQYNHYFIKYRGKFEMTMTDFSTAVEKYETKCKMITGE